MEKRKVIILFFVSFLLASNLVLADIRETSLRLNRLKILNGDANADGKVDIFDLAAIGLYYGTKDTDGRWNWKVDIANTEGEIDIFDLAEVGLNYGNSYIEAIDDPVFISPASKDVDVGAEFTIDVDISTSANVYAGEFIITFNPSVLEVLEVTEGNFLKKDGASTYPITKINNTEGKIEFANTRFGTASGVTGDGSLVLIKFKAKINGTSPIGISSLSLVDPSLNPIAGVATEEGIVNVGLEPENNPPTLTGVPDKNVDEDTTPASNWIDLYLYADDIEDTDAQLTFSIQSQSNSALINCNIAGNRYLNCNKPSLNQNGYSDVVIKVTDTAGASDTDTTRITVNSINDLPEAVDDSAVTTEDTLVKIDVLANDKDVEGAVTLDAITSPPGHGSAIINAGKVDYTPSLGYNGPDSFEYRIKDSNGATDTAKVNITVKEENDAPVIDKYSPLTNPTINEKQSQDFSITASDPDIGDVLTIKWYLNGIEVETGDSYTYTSTNCVSQGTHEVKAVVSDGESSVQHVWQLTVLDTCTKVQLKAGNNIFSLPRNQQKTFNQLDTDCEVVIEGRADLAYYKPDAIDLINNSNYIFVGLNDILYPGQGYFIKVENDCYIEMTGPAVGLADIGYLDASLDEGWNLIGSTTSMTKFSAGTCGLFGGIGILKYVYDVSNCEGVEGYNWGYEYCTNEFGVDRCRCGVDNFEPGFGYWIRTANDCSLA